MKRIKTKWHRIFVAFLAVFLLLALGGCVDQSQGKQTMETDVATGTAVSESEQAPEADSGQPAIIATSMATVDICDKLELSLAGVPKSDLYELPERYKELPTVGTAMAPDMEIVSSLDPDWILSPVSLVSDLRPKYEAQNFNYAFLNLNSVEGMYKSIRQLGQIFDREEQAEALVKEFTDYYDEFRGRHEGQASPKILVLMGLPGSYVVATEKSYVGSLVKMAGGTNVYAGEEKDFINVNTEDMLKKNPDIILRTAHALPDEVMEMFADEFKTNDIWKHFEAVKKDKVYDLSYEKFGMSANFSYPEALEELEKIFYE